MRGYLAPCGCSENMRGGIARAAAQLDEAHHKGLPVTYLDAGDSLFPSTKLADAAVPQDERKAKAIAAAYQQMGLSARAVGPRDLARGRKFLDSLGLPELANGQGRTVPLGGHTLGVVAGDDAKQLLKAAKQVRASGAEFVIALFPDTFEAAQTVANEPELAAQVSLIVASHAANDLEGENNRLLKTRIPVAQVQNKGRSLMRVDLFFAAQPGPFEELATQQDVQRSLDALSTRIELLTKEINYPGLDPQAKALRQQKLQELVQRREAMAEQKAPTAEGRNAFSVRFIPLESTLPSAEDVSAVVTAYDREVGQLNLLWAKKHGRDCPAAPKGKPSIVGNARCRDCHEDAFKVYDTTKHAHAYGTLIDKGKQYNLDCVSCHVTGYQQPGGVCRIDKVKGREGVGCESCHGPGSIHAEDPSDDNILAGNDEHICVRCHDPENSPHFDFRTYLPQILGPDHGEKAKKKLLGTP